MRIDSRVRFAAFTVIASGALAACGAGSFGSGTGVPNGAGVPSGPFVQASPSPTPANATGIVTVGKSAAFQQLPAFGGYGAQIAFPIPSAKPSGPPPDEISVGVTTSLAKPEAAPDLNIESGKGKRAKHRANPARPLFFITLLPTHDATLDTLPRIALDVPRETAAAYRDGDYGLALYNEGDKDRVFRLSVAERETGASPAPSAAASGSTPASASPAPSPSPTPRPGSSGATPTPAPSPTLPPQRIVFTGPAMTLKLVANRPLVFAVYALPPRATPKPSPSGAAAGSAAPKATGSAAAASDGSPSPVASSASASAAPSGSASPSATPSTAPTR